MLESIVVARTASTGGAHGRLLLLTRLLVCAVVAVAALLMIGSSVARAESLCTDTWTGPAEGSWETPSDWSTGKVPSSTDVACIGSGKTVSVEPGVTAHVGVLQVEGALAIKGGTLEPTGGLSGDVSHVSTLTQTSGWLDGPGTVDVTKTLAWNGEGTMTGNGRLVLAKTGTGSGNNYLTIKGYMFVNEGEWSFSSGAIRMSEGGRFENVGVFYTSEKGEVFRVESTTGGIPKVVNRGLFERRSATETTYVEVPFENTGRVYVAGGTLEFNSSAGSSSSTSGKWEAASGASLKIFAHEMSSHKDAWLGAVSVGSITVSELAAQQVTVEGTFTVESGTSTTEALMFAGGTITGAGTLDVSKSFTWTGKEDTMTGTGKTVLEKGATGTIAPNGLERYWDYLKGGYTLVNEGTLTTSNGVTFMSEGAVFKNTGTYYTSDTETVFFYQSGGSAPRVVNTGLFERQSGKEGSYVSVPFENTGRVYVAGGKLAFNGTVGSSSSVGGEWTAAGGASLEIGDHEMSSHKDTWSGAVSVGSITVSELEAKNAQTTLGGTLTVEAGTSTTEALAFKSGTITGPGTLDVTKSFSWTGLESVMTGSGRTVLEKGVTGTISIEWLEHYQEAYLKGGYTLINEGTLKTSESDIALSEGAKLKNTGNIYLETSGTPFTVQSAGAQPIMINDGLVEKRGSTETTTITVPFENYGTTRAAVGKLNIEHPVAVESSESQYGTGNPSALGPEHPTCGKPVDCVTGNETETQADIEVGGRGVGLDLTRYYNAQAAAAGEHGVFGYGWSSSFGDHLVFNTTAHTVTVVQANGSTVSFSEEGGKLVAPMWTQDTLIGNSTEGYTLTMSNQTVYKFSGTGKLESVTDRNGNKTSLGYNEKGQLTTITDPSGRKITLAYNAEGLVESATDPLSHVVKYVYEAGQLVSVTLPGQTSPRWKFKYDASHRMTSMVNGLGGETVNTYNASNQVISQKEPGGATLKWEYEPFKTKITNESTGSVTVEEYTSTDEVNAITRGYGTANATTGSFTYNERGEPLTHTDGNGHTTSYEYDGEGNKIKQTDPEGHETKWTYNAKHQITTETLPSGEKTTVEYDEHGNPVKVTRPAPESKTQETKYEYNAAGEMTAMIDPLARKWTYGYDEAGDRTSETDPEADKTTWVYNQDSQKTSEVAPARNVTGGKPAEYTTVIERNALGQPVKVTQPEGQETRYEYNADGEQTAVTDANAHKTTTTYNSEDLPIKVTQPSGAVQETEYNGTGLVVAQIDGNKHATKYVRNVLGRVIEEVNPLEKKTKKTYDGAGNLATVTDAAGRTTTYSYNKQNRLSKVSYSEAGMHTTEYEYTPNGQLASMIDGTGTTSYTYDQLGRLVETKDGHGDVVGYGYDLANEATSITYPNGKTVKDGYDKAGRLSTVSDWLSHTTSFAYTPESQVATESFPEASGESDHYAYNRTGQQTEAKMSKGTETLAQVAYTRDGLGQVSKATQTGLPGEAASEYAYSQNEQLEKAGASGFEYDPAGNPTKLAGVTGTFNAGDELTGSGGTSYPYNEVGQRTQSVPSGQARVYRSTLGAGRFVFPTYVAFDSAGNAWVTDAGHNQVLEFNSKGEFVQQFGSYGTGNGQFKEPRAIAIDSKNNVWVADTANGRIQEFNSKGEFIRAIDAGEKGDLSVAVDGEGHVWVLEQTLSGWYVHEFSAEGVSITTFGGEGTGNGQFFRPRGIAIDGKNNVWVADSGNSRIQEFNSKGEFIRKFGTEGSVDGQFKEPQAITVDSKGDVWVADTGNRRIQVFTSEGAYLGQFGSAGKENWQFSGPLGVTVDAEGNTWVADPGSGRVQKWVPNTISYTYNQAGEQISAKNLEGEPKLEDTYTYDGNNLRATETINGTTKHLTWQLTGRLPQLLNDNTNSYIYGPENTPIEQINTKEETQYLHHDQAGSTRLITNSTGTVEGTYTYTPYGTTEGHTGTATTPLGYDAQYTSPDTGLIYLRNRVYDPATAQFMSVDPLSAFTRAPYTYAGDNPLTFGDPTGLFPWEAIAEGVGVGAACLLGPEVCVPAGLIAIDTHVIGADVNSVVTGCSPWPEIIPALVAGGVSTLPFSGGLVAKDVWEASRTAFRIGATGGITSGGLAGAAVASNNNVSCGC